MTAPDDQFSERLTDWEPRLAVDRLCADRLPMTDEEILSPGPLEFPNGGSINVHSISSIADEGEVYYARRMPGSEEWVCMRTSVKRFLAGVRKAVGYRAQ